MLVLSDVRQSQSTRGARHGCDRITRTRSGTSSADGALLLPLLLIIQQISCCLPPAAHVVEGGLFDNVVVVGDPAGVPVLLARVAINTITNVMA